MNTRAALLLFVAAVLGGSSEASAALTPSEKAQLRDFVASARMENAGRVRTLVARTDHTEAESITALVEAVTPVPWSPERAAFLKEVVFGGASAASRPLLAVATTKAMLSRADAVYQKYTGGLDHEPRAVSELVAIYAFLDGEIANAPKQSGIPVASYEAASKAMREHVEQNQRWLKGDGTIAEPAVRVRAQAQILLFDLLPEGTTRNVDAADRLGLKGARKQMLTDWGMLLEDSGKLDEPKAAAIRSVLARLPGARDGVQVVYAGEDRSELRARGNVAYVRASGADAYPFDADVNPGTLDAATAATSGIALDLSVRAARRALLKNAELSKQCEADAIAAQFDPKKQLGRPRAPGVDQVVGAAIHLLVLDPARTIDLAFMRYLDGRKESAALLSDAVGALAAYSPTQLDLAKPFSAIKLASNGAATGFTVDGKAWVIDRGGANGAVAKITRDGAPVTLGNLSSARTPTHEGMSWSESGYTFTKMRGTPQVGLAGGDKGITVKLVGTGAKGYDAAGTIPSDQDFVLEGDVKVTGAAGGLAIRAVQGRDAVRGAVLVFIPGAGGRTMLAVSDDAGAESLLGAAIDPTPAMPVHVKITVQGTKVEAVVGGTTIKGTLPATLAKGEVAVIAKKGATVEVSGFTVKKK